ncbi:ADP-ribose glycohydrolase MACROD1-like [Bradysia coprophila]|uniref:ADP-ribose glycohydrolase MACROD1-like n=1 Tax=Bradysia coprophila TaxID=38358 RepID=UPI00187DBBF2|nr:ADP-ribose glycohydrolase MACROD1-like [Bradysia coprophila]
MINWVVAKTALEYMPIDEKRDLYKCHDKFKTVDDIVDWSTYVRNKFSSCIAEKDSHEEDEKIQTDVNVDADDEDYEAEADDYYYYDEDPDADIDLGDDVESSESSDDDSMEEITNDNNKRVFRKGNIKGSTENDASKENTSTGDSSVIATNEAVQSDDEKKKEFVNSRISVFIGDIICLEIDAIVVTASEELFEGGRVYNPVICAAGPMFLRAECGAMGALGEGAIGNAKISGGYKLPAKYIIHAVGPKGEHPDQLRSCYKRAMDLLKEHKLETIAFSCLSTGIYGYPNESAANVALETIRNWLEEEEYSAKVKRVIFCLSDQHDIDIYHKLMSEYFPLPNSLE